MSQLYFREATPADLPAIVEMLANDPLGSTREQLADPLPDSYLQAFQDIDHDHNNELWLACFADAVVGVLQLTYIPSLTYQGSYRAQIEGVRIAEAYRSQGLGEHLVQWAVEQAKEKGCRMVQLTTDKTRKDALHFYERLGFKSTHEGMKLHLKEL